jgi:GH25 family lysozyme M1 (1,4-beta-N-acetylmuramidase)
MRASGIDYSFWATDWKLPVRTRVDFAIQRLGAAEWLDPRYENHAKRLGQAQIRGGYWYYYEQYNWAKQVDMFLDAANNHPHKLHMLWWDVEEGGNDFSNRERIANETAESIRRLEERYDGLVGLYSNLDFYINYLQPYLADHFAKIPLWLAWPIHTKPLEYFRGDVEPGWSVWRGGNEIKMKRPKGSWFMWQVKFNGDPDYYGIIDKKAVDVNVFNGTAQEMRECFGVVPWWIKFKQRARKLRRLER